MDANKYDYYGAIREARPRPVPQPRLYSGMVVGAAFWLGLLAALLIEMCLTNLTGG